MGELTGRLLFCDMTTTLQYLCAYNKINGWAPRNSIKTKYARYVKDFYVKNCIHTQGLG